MIIKKIFFLVTSLFMASGYCEEKEGSMVRSLFTPPGDFSLQTHALDVAMNEIMSEETQLIIDEMFQIARGERDDTGENRVMVGLAAPQIGYSKRIILVDVGVDRDTRELGSLIAYINPEITWYSDEIEEGREGCYSVDNRIIGIVPRSLKIRVKGFDRNGVAVDELFSGFTARIFQHEIDHLNGIRFPDRIDSEEKLHWVEDNQYEEYKNSYENWDFKCPRKLWTAMKNGEPYTVSIKEVFPDQSELSYTFQEQDQKYFIGLELKTNNEKCSAAMPLHKERFFRENILEKIPNKVGDDILAVYTDYEKDCRGDYSWILGCEVSSLDEVPAGLVGKVIPQSQYAVFTTEGEFPQGLIDAWLDIWRADLSRTYTTDFELYRAQFDPETNPEVKVYIAIESRKGSHGNRKQAFTAN